MEPSSASASRRGEESGTGGVMEPKRAAAAADRLSSLPTDLQDEILVRLDLRDAVRTSVLSRGWRHLWKSLSVLSVSFPPGTQPSVIDSVLLPYNGPRVSRFDINVDDESAGRLDDWLVALSRCSVESIDMRGQPDSDHYFNLNSSIFSFGALVSLNLRDCNIPPLPAGFAGFPALQELGLQDVDFPANGDNQLEAIIRRSSLLHTLHMWGVYIPDDCPDTVIETPSLRMLTIVGTERDNGWRIGELPCLEYANIDVGCYLDNVPDFGDFIAHFAHVQELNLFSPYDDRFEIPNTLPSTFHNLKKLKLFTDFNEMHPVLFMFTLLRSCPNLEDLEIEIRYNFDDSIEADLDLNALWTNGMCANLQTVQIFCIGWLSNEISFMSLILSKARLLRTLYVDRHPDCFDGPVIDLLKGRRASAEARVLFEDLDEADVLCIAECNNGSDSDE